jgi:hypothetical protein
MEGDCGGDFLGMDIKDQVAKKDSRSCWQRHVYYTLIEGIDKKKKAMKVGELRRR